MQTTVGAGNAKGNLAHRITDLADRVSGVLSGVSAELDERTGCSQVRGDAHTDRDGGREVWALM
jgi:hypothetical protein